MYICCVSDGKTHIFRRCSVKVLLLYVLTLYCVYFISGSYTIGFIVSHNIRVFLSPRDELKYNLICFEVEINSRTN